MKQSNFTAFALTAILSVLAAYVIGIGQTLDSFSFRMDDDQYAASGLDKLTPEELTNLFRFLETIPRISYLEESAAHYFQEEGWETVQLYGVQKLKLEDSDSEDDYLVGVLQQETRILRLPMLVDRLPPGWYWVKPSHSYWMILHPNGEDELYWIEETRE
jgi:hypothetical protein